MHWLVALITLSSVISVGHAQTAYSIDTFAGTSWVGDGGQARLALLLQPEGIAIDSLGTIYLSDAGDHRIRRIKPDGTIETIIGTGFPGASSKELNAPYGIALDRTGNLYIADLGNARVRRLSPDGKLITIAGGGTAELQLNTKTLATTVRLREPRNVLADSQGNVYISDFGAHRVYRLDQQGYITPFAGTGERGYTGDGSASTQATLAFPAGLAMDAAGTLYIADSGNRRVRKITNNVISSVLDKNRKPAEFGVPTGVFVDALQTLYIADRSEVTTMMRPDGTTITMPIGGGEVATDPSNRIYTTGPRLLKRYDGRLATIAAGNSFGLFAGDGRPSSEWRFNEPAGITQDSKGNIYIADSANGRIRQINAAGELRSVAFGFVSPAGIAVDSQDRVVFADSKASSVIRLDGAGKPTILAQNWKQPVGIAVDRNDAVYVADPGSNLIKRINGDGSSTVIAGAGFNDGDGPALECRLQQPYGVALDGKGALLFTEAGSARVRKLDLASFRISTVRKQDLVEPRGIAVDREGTIFVTDYKLNRVLQIQSDGALRPIAGSGEPGFEGDNGPALAASFRAPLAVAVTESAILVADTGNGRIRRLQRLPGEVATVTAPPAPVPLPAPGKITVLHAALNKPAALAPGQLVSIEVENLNPKLGWQLTFNGIPASVLQWKPAVVAIVPATLTPGAAKVTLSGGGTESASASVQIAPSAPALFEQDGIAMAVNSDGTLNSIQNPAPRGSVLSVFLTGVGSDPGLISANIGEIPATIWYAGDAPGLPGVYQINLELPGGFASPGPVSISIAISGAITQDGMRVATR